MSSSNLQRPSPKVNKQALCTEEETITSCKVQVVSVLAERGAMAKFFHWSLVLPLFLCLKVTAENPWRSKTPMSVMIYNDIPGSIVEVDCVCHKCHDLSVVQLQHKSLPWRTAFEFEFKMSVLGSTYVWCKMVWGENWNAFKVWNGPGMWGTQRMPCQQCVVDVKSEGIFQGQKSGELVWVKTWMQNPPSIV